MSAQAVPSTPPVVPLQSGRNPKADRRVTDTTSALMDIYRRAVRSADPDSFRKEVIELTNPQRVTYLAAQQQEKKMLTEFDKLFKELEELNEGLNEALKTCLSEHDVLNSSLRPQISSSSSIQEKSISDASHRQMMELSTSVLSDFNKISQPVIRTIETLRAQIEKNTPELYDTLDVKTIEIYERMTTEEAQRSIAAKRAQAQVFVDNLNKLLSLWAPMYQKTELLTLKSAICESMIKHFQPFQSAISALALLPMKCRALLEKVNQEDYSKCVQEIKMAHYSIESPPGEPTLISTCASAVRLCSEWVEELGTATDSTIEMYAKSSSNYSIGMKDQINCEKAQHLNLLAPILVQIEVFRIALRNSVRCAEEHGEIHSAITVATAKEVEITGNLLKLKNTMRAQWEKGNSWAGETNKASFTEQFNQYFDPNGFWKIAHETNEKVNAEIKLLDERIVAIQQHKTFLDKILVNIPDEALRAQIRSSIVDTQLADLESYYRKMVVHLETEWNLTKEAITKIRTDLERIDMAFRGITYGGTFFMPEGGRNTSRPALLGGWTGFWPTPFEGKDPPAQIHPLETRAATSSSS